MSYLSLFWLATIAVVPVVFWAAPARYRFFVLIGATAAALAYLDPISLVTLVALTALTRALSRGQSVSGARAALATAAIAAVLVGFKIASGGIGGDVATDIAIPLGLSYYALRCIHFVLERYKGRIEDPGGRDLISYLFFVPTIFIGPIHRFPDFSRDLRRHRWDPAFLAEGLERIIYGLFKIAFLANFVVANLMDSARINLGPDQAGAAVYAAMVGIGVNLYLQFSGHSDIAIGFARLLGFRVMENFNWPYLKTNISEFWRAWHISLTSWSREYVYTGVVALTRSPALGAIATLVAIGLWHEISLRYLIWGAYHGLAIVAWQRFQGLKRLGPEVRSTALRRLLDVLSVILTVHFVWLGFLLVRQDSLAEMGSVIVQMFTGGW